VVDVFVMKKSDGENLVVNHHSSNKVEFADFICGDVHVGSDFVWCITVEGGINANRRSLGTSSVTKSRNTMGFCVACSSDDLSKQMHQVRKGELISH
jgi:hypothetical protein